MLFLLLKMRRECFYTDNRMNLLLLLVVRPSVWSVAKRRYIIKAKKLSTAIKQIATLRSYPVWRLKSNFRLSLIAVVNSPFVDTWWTPDGASPACAIANVYHRGIAEHDCPGLHSWKRIPITTPRSLTLADCSIFKIYTRLSFILFFKLFIVSEFVKKF